MSQDRCAVGLERVADKHDVVCVRIFVVSISLLETAGVRNIVINGTDLENTNNLRVPLGWLARDARTRTYRSVLLFSNYVSFEIIKSYSLFYCFPFVDDGRNSY